MERALFVGARLIYAGPRHGITSFEGLLQCFANAMARRRNGKFVGRTRDTVSKRSIGSGLGYRRYIVSEQEISMLPSIGSANTIGQRFSTWGSRPPGGRLHVQGGSFSRTRGVAYCQNIRPVDKSLILF